VPLEKVVYLDLDLRHSAKHAAFEVFTRGSNRSHGDKPGDKPSDNAVIRIYSVGVQEALRRITGKDLRREYRDKALVIREPFMLIQHYRGELQQY
jgi:hypothetical protein